MILPSVFRLNGLEIRRVTGAFCLEVDWARNVRDRYAVSFEFVRPWTHWFAKFDVLAVRPEMQYVWSDQLYGVLRNELTGLDKNLAPLVLRESIAGV